MWAPLTGTTLTPIKMGPNIAAPFFIPLDKMVLFPQNIRGCVFPICGGILPLYPGEKTEDTQKKALWKPAPVKTLSKHTDSRGNPYTRDCPNGKFQEPANKRFPSGPSTFRQTNGYREFPGINPDQGIFPRVEVPVTQKSVGKKKLPGFNML